MTAGRGARRLRLPDLTWPEVAAALGRGVSTALVAAGSTEQHGPHLPLATDTLLGEALCERLADRLGGALIAPAIPVGRSDIHMDFPGSLTADETTLAGLLHAYCASLARHGVTHIVVIPSHGGNVAWVRTALAGLRERLAGARVSGFTDWAALRAAFDDVMRRDGLRLDAPGLHAGEVETSMMLHLHPELVRMDRAQAGAAGPAAGAAPYSGSLREASAIGVLGDPRTASAERGERYLDAWVRLVAAHATTETGG